MWMDHSFKFHAFEKTSACYIYIYIDKCPVFRMPPTLVQFATTFKVLRIFTMLVKNDSLLSALPSLPFVHSGSWRS